MRIKKLKKQLKQQRKNDMEIKRLINQQVKKDIELQNLIESTVFADDFVMTEEDEDGNLIDIETGEVVGNIFDDMEDIKSKIKNDGFVDLGIIYTK